MLNKVILIGRLGTDVELRQTVNGNQVANFSLAVSEKWKDKSGQQQEKTEWLKIIFWEKQAELCSTYLKKGYQVYIEGKITTRKWEDKEGQTKYSTEINGSSVIFLQNKKVENKDINNAVKKAKEVFAADEIPF